MGYSNFHELINARKSANNFIEGVEITESELNEIFSEVILGPSCFNLQHTKYLVIKDKGMKEVFRDKACPQYKVHTASAAIIVLGNKKAYKDTERIYEPMKVLGMLDEISYSRTVQDIYNMYEGRGESFTRDEAIRNASLSAMMFMLAAKDKGWDTCPMIGFNINETKKLFHIEDDYEPALLITIGKEDPNNIRLRGYRKPVSEFVKYI
ncbi:putative NAD(P)H nitroreductase [Clostridium acidisoli DSM 12555]|jgi:putative NAD(P)H nitroreductase|uniref:Putative NAD(P)H nitroreductase n=1 Tax=Clostridium acidisoli DSM 12555 TaxID=1121291 RepID=A0A1W1XUL6_9CLOT|nr:nitroreductase family protein [Clostridium acidisoli]SMC27534.1 putative NAD(P)H nitroreductase [Clostridium acidisoli DSM 12555]